MVLLNKNIGCALQALVITMSLVIAANAQDREEPVIIEWPNPDYSTLQSAIDALRDGDTLRMAEGRIPLLEPLFVRGKRVIIEGAGCDWFRRGRSGSKRVTHIIGPPVERVVDFEDAVAAINYDNDAGGTLRGVKFTGFDAGFRSFSESAEAPGTPISIEDVCFGETGRGIVLNAPSSLFAQNVIIRNTLWNAVSIGFAKLLGAADSDNTQVNLSGFTVLDSEHACLAFRNTIASVSNTTLTNCGPGGGIVAESSLVQIHSTSIFPNFAGPGITTSKGGYVIDNVNVAGASGGGIIFLDSPNNAQVTNAFIGGTGPLNGALGDGILVFGGGSVYVTNSLLSSNTRAGIGNIGSFVGLQDTDFTCNGFDLDGETLGATPAQFQNLGGNGCGCTVPSGGCTVQSSGISAPNLIIDPL